MDRNQRESQIEKNDCRYRVALPVTKPTRPTEIIDCLLPILERVHRPLDASMFKGSLQDEKVVVVVLDKKERLVCGHDAASKLTGPQLICSCTSGAVMPAIRELVATQPRPIEDQPF